MLKPDAAKSYMWSALHTDWTAAAQCLRKAMACCCKNKKHGWHMQLVRLVSNETAPCLSSASEAVSLAVKSAARALDSFK